MNRRDDGATRPQTARRRRWLEGAARLDGYLLGVSTRTKCFVVLLTILAMTGESARYLPRPYLDYSRIPILHHFGQPDGFGSDTLADRYESRVILNDLADMYTKREAPQTPEEASAWSKAESAPYPPAVLLSEAALYAIGERTGLEFYGMVLLLAGLFLALSLIYFFATKWYLFPLLYLNFSYFGYRFVFVQDGSYLVMLVVVMAALFLARARREACHALMAVAIDMKLAPCYYAKNVLLMRPASAIAFVTILVLGLAVPYFVWDNYLYIFQFNATLKGDRYGLLAGIVYATIFSVLLAYIEARLPFDMEDRIGWGLVPFAMFLAMKMNVPRHLLIVLLVPDKRGHRNIAAAIGLILPILMPGVVRFGSVLSITTGLLFLALAMHLDRIGWATVRDDLSHPQRTLRMMFARAAV